MYLKNKKKNGKGSENSTDRAIRSGITEGSLGCICQSFRVSVTEQSMKGGAEIYKPPTILNRFRANQACLTRTRNAWAAQKKKKKNVSDRL